MRLIDADDFISRFNHVPLVQEAIKKAMDCMPTIEERKTGEWNCGDDMFEYAICSACKWDSGEAWEYAKKHFRYCPSCGARMEGNT